MASEGGSGLPELPTSSLEIYTIDWSILQTFRHWKPYSFLPEYSWIERPEVETEEGKAGVYKELALFELFLRDSSLATAGTGK